MSRRLVQLSQVQLALWLVRPIGELDLSVVMIDGIHLRDRVILLALGIDAQGNKHVLGLREGATEATRVVASLLSDLIERGPAAVRLRLWVIDGGKALGKAIVQTFGQRALIQRCQEQERRNLREHLPADAHAGVKRRPEACVVGLGRRSGAQATRPPGVFAAGQASWGRGQRTQGPGGDAAGAGDGHHLRAVPQAANDQSHREPPRPGGARLPQRQALG